MFRSVRRPPRRRWLRTAKLVLGGVLVALVLLVAVVGAVWGEAWLRLGGEPVSSLDADVQAMGEEGPQAPAGTSTVLVALVTDHDPTAVGGEPLAGPVALVQAGDAREDVAVVLLPGGLEVGVDGEGAMALDAVHQQGGVDLLARAVMDYTGVALDHAVVATAEALPRLTSAVGGIERCDDDGCRVLDADAVRAATLEGSPADQARVVDEVVRGVAREVRPAMVLRSPLRSRSVVTALSQDVVTDVSLRGARTLDLAGALGSSRPLTLATLPGVVNPDTDQLVVRPEQAETLFQHLRQGSSLDGEAAAEPTDAVPEDVAVAVHNGAGVAGLAGRIESQLQGAGFTVLGTENATRFDHETTTVAYGVEEPDAEMVAILLAEQLGEVELDPRERPPSFEGEPVDVLVTVGEDLDDGQDD